MRYRSRSPWLGIPAILVSLWMLSASAADRAAASEQGGADPRLGRDFIPTPVYTREEDEAVLKLFAGLRVADVTDGMDKAGLQNIGLVSPSLKEFCVSRATWRIFVRNVSGKAVEGLVNAAFELLLRNRIVESVFTVFLFEVVEPFFSFRLHPYTSLRESFRRNRRKVRSA
jgi:hypothetical protein